MEIKIVTDLATEPVTLQEAKDFLRISNDAENTLISELITDARQRLEKFTNLSFGAKTLKCRWNALDNWQEIPYQPNAVISSCVNDDNVALTYKVRGLEYKAIYCNNNTGITITYTAGFTMLPKPLKMAILKEVATNYENRENYIIGEAVNELSSNAKMIAQSYSRNTLVGI